MRFARFNKKFPVAPPPLTLFEPIVTIGSNRANRIRFEPFNKITMRNDHPTLWIILSNNQKILLFGESCANRRLEGEGSPLTTEAVLISKRGTVLTG